MDGGLPPADEKWIGRKREWEHGEPNAGRLGTSTGICTAVDQNTQRNLAPLLSTLNLWPATLACYLFLIL